MRAFADRRSTDVRVALPDLKPWGMAPKELRMKLSTLIANTPELADNQSLRAMLCNALNMFDDHSRVDSYVNLETLGEVPIARAIDALRTGIKSVTGVANRRFKQLLELVEDGDANYYNDAISHAIDAFWKAFASQYPEIKSGDLPPDANGAFMEAAHDACGAWMLANKPDPVGGKLAKDGMEAELWSRKKNEFFSSMPSYNGWKCSTEGMTGGVYWWREGQVARVWATPDHDVDGTISIDLEVDDDWTVQPSSIGLADQPAWAFDKRNAESYMDILRPYLDRWTVKTVVATYTVLSVRADGKSAELIAGYLEDEIPGQSSENASASVTCVSVEVK